MRRLIALAVAALALAGCGHSDPGQERAERRGDCLADVAILDGGNALVIKGMTDIANKSANDSLRDCVNRAGWLSAAKAAHWESPPMTATALLALICNGETSRVCAP